MSDFNVGFVIFPDLTQLDFTGPFEVSEPFGDPSVPLGSQRVRTFANPRCRQVDATGR